MLKEKTKKKIIDVLKKSERPLSKTEISKLTKISAPTIGKYVDILAVEGKLKVDSFKIIDLVSIKK